ncbi:uncharacterized protein LOC101784603 isoform X1 [Setaria italica]|uniref:uncharacterized protein LOC101784603 isoform X1 n=1 Tax=Setaria italica TaxID=4555 RepID=UPI000BE4F0F3|nr:uncharacterized protein LOC101784603 isoform X1 [Setaria italica]
MDPCAFVRLTVDQLLLKLPAVQRPSSGAGVHPSTSPCFCTLSLQDHPASLSRTALLPLASAAGAAAAAAHADPVVLSLDAEAVRRLSARPAELVVSVHAGQTGTNCGISAARALGRVRVSVDVARAAAGETVVARDGWVDVGKPGSASSASSAAAASARAQIHMVVRAEPDPRYVFQFGGEPECGPVVYQVPGGAAGGGQRQPVFTCRFSAGRRATRSRYRDDTPTVHVMDLPTQLLINLLCEDRIAGSESSIYQVQLTLHEIADAAVVHDPEHQPEAEVLAQRHPPRRRPRRLARVARAAQGVDGDHPRPVGLPRGGGVDGDPVRAVPGLRPRLPRQPGLLAHPPGHGRRAVKLEALGAPRGVARARARRRARVPPRVGLRLGPPRVRRPHRRVLHQHQARRAVRHRPGHIPGGHRRRRVAVRRRLRHGLHGGGRGAGEPAHRAGRRAARDVHGRRCGVRRAVRGRRSLHGRLQALLAAAQEGAVPGPGRLKRDRPDRTRGGSVVVLLGFGFHAVDCMVLVVNVVGHY